MPDKTVLITGAGGFIGQQTLQPLIDLGYQVHAVSRGRKLNIPHVRWHSCDLLNAAATDKLLADIHPTHLLHTAWYAEHGKYWTAPENTVWLEASTQLFEKFITCGGKRILSLGTCAEYDWQRQDKTPWKETDACNPSMPYGQAKLALLQRLSALPVSYAWARIFMLFGPDEKPARLVPYTIGQALAGEPILCSEGTQLRDFIDTHICGRALAQTLESDVMGAVNIGAGETLSIAELIKMICSLCSYTGEIKFGALAPNKNDPPFIVPDLSRLRNEVKFTEKQDTRKALSDMIAELKKSASV